MARDLKILFALWCVLVAAMAGATTAASAEPPPGKAVEARVEPSPGPFHWDDLRAGQSPRWHLFSGEFPAGMLRRPAELTLDNWFHDGYLRIYALLNLDEVVRCVEIGRGKGPVYMFGNARQPDLLDKLTVTIPDETFPKRNTPIPLREAFSLTNGQAILVVRNGKIVFEEYPGMDPAQRHHWMSISKSSLNMLLGKLVTEGRLDLSRKVEEYVPELAGKGYGGFSVQELADMDADVDMNENNYANPQAPFWKWGRAVGWFSDDGQWPGGVKQLLGEIKRLPKATGEAAEKVRYTSSNSQVIAWIVEKRMKKPLIECFEENLWRHIGAVANASVSVDKLGVPFAGGGYRSTLRDLARYGTIWANKGVAPDGTRICAEDWIKENTRGKGPKVYRDYCYHNQSYSKGSALAHQGHSGQMLWTNPTTGTIVACFGSITHPGGQDRWSGRVQLLMAEAIDRFLVEQRIAEQ